MSPDDPSLTTITRKLTALGVSYRIAVTVREACSLFPGNKQPLIVVSGVTLTDGNWCDVLGSTVKNGLEARLVVCCIDADERLWSEVVWRGGHDVLVEPYDLDHLSRTLGLSQQAPEAHPLA
jgi:hypothetical protein